MDDVVVVVFRTGSWALQSQQMLHHPPGYEMWFWAMSCTWKIWQCFFKSVLVNPVQRREALCTTSRRSLWCFWGCFYFSGKQWYQLWDQTPLCPISYSSKDIFGILTKWKSQPGSTHNWSWKWNKALANYVAHHEKTRNKKTNKTKTPPRIQQLQQFPRSCSSLLQTSAGCWGCQAHTCSCKSHCHQGMLPVVVSAWCQSNTTTIAPSANGFTNTAPLLIKLCNRPGAHASHPLTEAHVDGCPPAVSVLEGNQWPHAKDSLNWVATSTVTLSNLPQQTSFQNTKSWKKASGHLDQKKTPS